MAARITFAPGVASAEGFSIFPRQVSASPSLAEASGQRQAARLVAALGIVELADQADGLLSAEHRVRVRKTTYPIEDGRRIADHAQVEPKTLKISGWVSDIMDRDGNPSGAIRAQQSWAEIVRLAEERQPVRVATNLGVYDSMLITSATAPEDSTTGRALRYEIELEEVVVAGVRREITQLQLPSGSPAEDRIEPEAYHGAIESPQLPIAIPMPITDEQTTPEPSLIDRISDVLTIPNEFIRKTFNPFD